MKKTVAILLVTSALFGCGQKVELTGFDADRWKNDTNGCKGDRPLIIDDLLEHKEKLKGLNQTDIVELIGKPDRNELYKRSQKFFEYQVSPDKSCDTPTTSKTNTYLSIRFTATGLAKEILVYHETIN